MIGLGTDDIVIIIIICLRTGVSAGASLNEANLNDRNWPLILKRHFLSRHPPKQRLSFSRHCPGSSSVCALYVAIFSLTLSLRQRIRPFAINKAFLGPSLHRTLPPPAAPGAGGLV